MKLVRIGKEIVNMDAVTLIMIHDEEPDNYTVTLNFAVPSVGDDAEENGPTISGWGFNGASAKMFIDWLKRNSEDVFAQPTAPKDA